MRNQVYANNTPGINLPVPAGTKTGDPVMVGSIVGVAATDRADSTAALSLDGVAANSSGNADGYASVLTDGGYLLTVSGAITGPGTPVYITGTGPFALSVTNGGTDTVFGYTVPGPDNKYATKAAGDGPAVVRIAQV
ncbi:hypothetical protein [Flexivirga sp.]|uniref:hypothetical protein n=1 Tax=Flexivirga sp. TaxID=1962927 RepID=UPI003F810E42